MAKNITHDSSRDLRHTRLILLSILFAIGVTGCSIVIYWLIRYARWNRRSSRICSLIFNLIIANLSVYLFATGIQIFWEFQTNRQWPFNEILCRTAKFFQSFSILSSTYIVVVMAIDRCLAIVTPLKVDKIRVLYLCGIAWTLAGVLSTPNIFIFYLHVNGSARYCSAIFNKQSTLTGRRIYLTFISLIVYFIPFLVLVLCYALIFIKLLWRERDQDNHFKKRSIFCFSCFLKNKPVTVTKPLLERINIKPALNRSSFSDFDARRQHLNTYAKARTKTFRMIIILVLFMIIFGAPYYCLELYIAYTGRKPSDLVLALAGGAAVAPSSIDPWIFLLFWAKWDRSSDVHTNGRIINQSIQHQQIQNLKTRPIRSNTTIISSSSSNEIASRYSCMPSGSTYLPPYTVRWNGSTTTGMKDSRAYIGQ